MFVHMTRFVYQTSDMLGYTSRHQLFVIVILLVFYLHSYSCYCYSVACLSCHLVILCLQLFLLLLYAHCLYARVLLFTHTLTMSLSDDPGFVRTDIGRFISIV